MNFYKKLLRRLAHFQVKHPYFTVFLIFSLTLIMISGAKEVRTVASLEQMMPKQIDEIKAFNTLRDNNMGQDIIGIVLEIDPSLSQDYTIKDVRDYRVYSYVKDISNILENEIDVLDVYSVGTIIDVNDEQSYVQSLYDPFFKTQESQFINSDKTTTVILATTDVSADDTRMNLLASSIKDHISTYPPPPGIKISYTGTPLIQQKLGELIGEDRSNTQWISTLLVFIITMIIFASFTSAVVPIIIVTISVNWLYGTMGFTGLPISTLAGGVAAMVIGIGIDFAIHIMNKFKFERKKGMSISKGIEQAVVDTGTALTATSITTIFAFLAFLSGAMPEMGRFGLLMAIGISYSLVFSIFGLPALLIIEEKIIYFMKKRAHFGIEGEFHLEDNKK